MITSEVNYYYYHSFTFSDPNKWKNYAENGVNFLDLISDVSLLEIVFGDIWCKLKELATQFLGCVGGLYALVCMLMDLWRMLNCSSKKRDPIILMDRRNYQHQKWLQQQNLDCDKDDERQFQLSYNNELFSYNNQVFQPPYNFDAM